MKQSTFMTCREAAAGEQFAFYPRAIYCWASGPLPETIRAYLANGVLEELEGKPGIGVDFTTLTPAMFAPPRPEPKREEPIDLDELLKRLNWSLDDLRKARGAYGFPAPHALIQPKFDESNPDAPSKPLWLWSSVEKYLSEAPGVGAGPNAGAK